MVPGGRAALALAASPAKAPAIAPTIAAGLARLGPRPPGTAAHAAAFELLRAAMLRAGLSRVETIPAPGPLPLRSLTGVLPGTTPGEIVLSAHYDTVPWSPGAGDDASGCATILAAVADLARTPLGHTVRVLLFDGEESGLLGSRAWLAARGPTGRERILAAVNVEMVGWSGSAGPVLLTFPVRRQGARAFAPGWLVHSLLRSGEAAGLPPSFLEAHGSLPAQLVLRATVPTYGADSDAFVAAGVPAATLSDSSLLHLDPAYHRQADTADRLDPTRLDRWVTATAAAVRRLDRLAGRPLPEDRYLVVFGRVWLPRDLYWIGFLLWGLLVVRNRPRRRPEAEAEQNRREGRAWRQRALPGFLFRLLFLVSVFLAPIFSVLLYPAVLLAHFPPRRGYGRVLWIVLGLAPVALLLYAILYAFAAEAVRGLAPGGEVVFVAGALVAYAAYIVLVVSPRGADRIPRERI
ncbi:MAG TPA: M28 family metallopeptidase [Thermoanaerobaculia bacterium]|nr:M28 family metallopeptidase [Thermoanaerobaculia bacterium]